MDRVWLWLGDEDAAFLDWCVRGTRYRLFRSKMRRKEIDCPLQNPCLYVTNEIVKPYIFNWDTRRHLIQYQAHVLNYHTCRPLQSDWAPDSPSEYRYSEEGKIRQDCLVSGLCRIWGVYKIHGKVINGGAELWNCKEAYLCLPGQRWHFMSIPTFLRTWRDTLHWPSREAVSSFSTMYREDPDL